MFQCGPPSPTPRLGRRLVLVSSPVVPHLTTNTGSSWHKSTGHRLCLRPAAQEQPDLGIRAHGMLVVEKASIKERNITRLGSG